MLGLVGYLCGGCNSSSKMVVYWILLVFYLGCDICVLVGRFLKLVKFCGWVVWVFLFMIVYIVLCMVWDNCVVNIIFFLKFWWDFFKVVFVIFCFFVVSCYLLFVFVVFVFFWGEIVFWWDFCVIVVVESLFVRII